MAGFSFAKRRDIEDVLKIIKEWRGRKPRTPVGLVGDPGHVVRPKHITENFVFKTTSTGIPGRVGDKPGSDLCYLYYLNKDDEFELFRDDENFPREHTVYNLNTEPVAGETFINVHRVYERLVAGGGGGGVGGNQIIFALKPVEYAEEPYSDDCADQPRDAAGDKGYEAEVLFRPCGVSKVPEEKDGCVTVFDDMGTWLEGRNEFDLEGRVGVAMYVQDSEDNPYDYEEPGCHWSIIFLDWWRYIQVITNVVLTSGELKFFTKQIKVWDDCDLDPIVIPVEDCIEEYYYNV